MAHRPDRTGPGPDHGQDAHRLEAHGHISRARGLSDRRSQVVSITDAGSTALVQAHDFEALVLSTAKVDTDKLRRELLTLVCDLAARDATPVAKTIVAAADEGL